MTHLPHPEYQHVVLLRHAETDQNAKGIVQGHLNTPPLRPDVPDTLVHAVLALEEEAGPLQTIYTTDLERGWAPAHALVRGIEMSRHYAHVSDPHFEEDGLMLSLSHSLHFHADPLLRERNLGGYQGQSYDVLIPPTPGQVVDKAVRRSQLIKILRELDDDKVTWGQGESLTVFKNRIRIVANLLIRPPAGYRVLVSHMGVLDHMLDELGDVMPNGQYRWANNLQGYHLVLKDGNLVEKRDFTPEIVYPDTVPASR